MLLILPGAIAILIVEALTVHKKLDAFRFTLYMSVLGFIAYLARQTPSIIAAYIYHTPSYKLLSFWGAISGKTTAIDWSEIFTTCLIAIPVGLVASSLIQYKALNRFANLIKLSGKYGDENLFSYFLSAKETNWVWVRDNKQGVTYYGKVEYYSETDSMKEIVLSEVSVYRSEDSAFIREAPYIYLSFAPNDFIIELVPDVKQEEQTT
jgi:hypothetical protein